MQLFYAPDISPESRLYMLTEEEAKHCLRVLRLGPGDRFHMTDGRGAMYEVELTSANVRQCAVRILECRAEFEKRPYRLHMAVAPTKNADRFEWFVEKATELGVDVITPLLTAHCERKVIKRERLEKVATGAVKQSLKAYHPRIDELIPYYKMIEAPFEGKKLIAYCEPGGEKRLLRDCVAAGEDVLILIGPEGDFSPEEVAAAYRNGFTGLSLGRSRLRTETAAVAAVHGIAFINE